MGLLQRRLTGTLLCAVLAASAVPVPASGSGATADDGAPPGGPLHLLAFDGGNPKSGILHRKLGHELARLLHEVRGRDGAVRSDRHAYGVQPDLPAARPVQLSGGLVSIEAVAAWSAAELLVDLRRLGLSHGRAYGRMVSGRLPIARLEQAAALPSLAFARPVRGGTRTGSVTGQGDPAVRAPQARSTYAVDGNGATVGILSDSFDCAGTGLAADVASGDLPPGTTILDDTGCPRSDEGRAMAQVIHDVAPGAALLFRAGPGGQADAALGIAELAAAGANVIVDDIFFLDEPMFQDGLIAQAIDDAAALGVAVFSAAGNRGSRSYAGPFRPSGIPVLFGGSAHDFDAGGGVDLYQKISIPSGGELVVTLQWDSPFFSVSGPPGSPNDLDICLLDEPPTTILRCGAALNAGGDPVEVLSYYNDGALGTQYNLVIELFEGAAPGLIKYIRYGDSAPLEYATLSGTLAGHANAAGAEAVAAAFYYDTPEFGMTPALVAASSARGGTPILFDTAGTRLSTPLLRDRPAITGPDGVNNTFFGADISDPGGQSDKDHLPNFFGTSAAAAHLAGVAALLIDRNGALAPSDLYAALRSTADDMDDPATGGFDSGFDVATGHGFCVADAALGAVPECGNGSVENPEQCDDGNMVDDDACGNDCLINLCGDGILHPNNNEQCDDGNGNDDDFCRNDCTPNLCGDGRLSNFSVELLVNGDFESGTFEGWTISEAGDGVFVIAAPGAPTPTASFATAPNPAGGAAYALTDPIGPGTRALQQSFIFPGSANALDLSFQMFVNDQSGLGPIVDPTGLDHNGPANQHARVDVLAAGSPPFDTGAGVVGNLYLGVDPGPTPNPYLSYSFDLTGILVPATAYRLRFAEVDNQSFLHLGVDNASLVASLLEECDDGNNLDGDGCSAACTNEGCSPPGEVTGVLMLADGTTLWWSAQSGASYDVVRAEGMPFGGGAPESCVAPATADDWATDASAPAPGAAFYYVVRARNGCGPGTYGWDSSGAVERLTGTCP